MALPRDIATDDPATRQTNFGGLALPGVGFFGLGDADFEADSFHFGAVAHRGGDGAAGFFWVVGGCGELG